MTRRQYRARWLTRRGIKGPELGESPHLATTLVGPIRNMRLFIDGVCINLLTLLKSRVLHAKSPPVLMSHSSYVSGRVAASTRCGRHREKSSPYLCGTFYPSARATGK